MENKYYLSCDWGSEYIKIILYEKDYISNDIKITEHICEKVDKSDMSPNSDPNDFKSTFQRIGNSLNLSKKEDILSKTEEVYVSINSSKLISLTVRHCISFDRPTLITKEILSELNKKIQSDLNKNETLVYFTINKFIIDSKIEVSDPLSIKALKIEAEFFIVKTETKYLNESKEILTSSNINVSSFIPGIIAQGEILLNSQEKNLGSCLIDVGYSTTNIISYHNGHITMSFTLDCGIKNIIETLADFLDIRYNDAYILFEKHTNLLQTHSDTPIQYKNLKNEQKEITVGKFNMLTENMIQQLFSQVTEVFRNNHIKIYIYTVTGGLSKLQGIKPLICKCFNTNNIKLGKLNDIKQSNLTNSKWAACFGMIQIQKKNKDCNFNPLYNIIYNIKKFFDNIFK